MVWEIYKWVPWPERIQIYWNEGPKIHKDCVSTLTKPGYTLHICFFFGKCKNKTWLLSWLTVVCYCTYLEVQLQYIWVLWKFLKFKKIKRAYVWNNKKIYWSGIYKTSLFWKIKIDKLIATVHWLPTTSYMPTTKPVP